MKGPAIPFVTLTICSTLCFITIFQTIKGIYTETENSWQVFVPCTGDNFLIIINEWIPVCCFKLKRNMIFKQVAFSAISMFCYLYF